ncbi:MAG: hypothetical protein QXN16_03115 [Candidatus Micrarchaeaceae archaeon]
MKTIRYANKKYPLHAYLSCSAAASLRLGFAQRLHLLLFGSVPLPEAVPPNSCAYTIFLVRSPQGLYFSYRQGWNGVFYVPKA